MSRVQLALNVADIDAAVEFYTALFRTDPHKRRPGYANFQILEPPLKLVLIETSADMRGHGVAGALNHVGIEVESTDLVEEAIANFQTSGLIAAPELHTNCCYAIQDKVWVTDPSGIPWEVYAITDDNPQEVGSLSVPMNDGQCCTPATALGLTPSQQAISTAACC